MAWWSAELSTGDAPARPGGLVLLFAASALTGLSRPDLTHAALVWPLVFWPAGRPWRRGLSALAVVVMASVPVWLHWIGADLGVALVPLTREHVGEWLLALVPPPFRGQDRPCGWPFGGAFDLGLGVALVAALLAGMRARARRVWLLLPAIVWLALPRLATEFHRSVFCSDNLAAQRYDLAPLTLLAALTAVGVAAGLATLRRLGSARPWPGPRATDATLALLALALGAALLVRAGQEPAPLSYRQEHRFLARAQQALPASATVATYWLEHWPGGESDPDTGLALPHALLAFARPDLRWVRLAPGQPLPRGGRVCVYHGALCSLDPAHLRATHASPATRQALARLRASCAKADARVTRWLAQERVPARAIFWHLKEDHATLCLGCLPPD